jgi:hypothetical protein
MNDCDRNLVGWEDYWESGDYVLYRARPKLKFPFDCDIFDTIIGCYSMPDGWVLDESGNLNGLLSRLVAAMKTHGVPVFDDITEFEGEGMHLVRQRLAGQITNDEFELRKSIVMLRDEKVRKERQQRHLERHPEQVQNLTTR